jgi:uncharacterized protein
MPRISLVSLLKHSILGVVLVAISAFSAVAAPEIELSARVTDLAGALTGQQIAALEQQLEALEKSKGAQVAVLTVATTNPETIEEFAIRVAEANRVGRARVDDGILFVIALQDRATRIEVGRGLEGAIPDAIAKRIIEERVVPKFKAGDIHGGVAGGVEAITSLINGEPLPPVQHRSPENVDLGGFLVVAFLVAVSVGASMKGVFGTLGGSLVGGVIAGVAGLIMGGLVVAILMFIFGMIFAAISGAAGLNTGSGRRGWSSGGGSFGGGWSGGGGGFSGGGASGRW